MTGNRLWDITQIVFMVVGALTIYALVAAVVVGWALRRLRGPRDEEGVKVARRSGPDRRAARWADCRRG